MKKYIINFLLFLCGFLAGGNMSGLIETNPDYNYAWWKVGLALIIAVFCVGSKE